MLRNAPAVLANCSRNDVHVSGASFRCRMLSHRVIKFRLDKLLTRELLDEYNTLVLSLYSVTHAVI